MLNKGKIHALQTVMWFASGTCLFKVNQCRTVPQLRAAWTVLRFFCNRDRDFLYHSVI